MFHWKFVKLTAHYAFHHRETNLHRMQDGLHSVQMFACSGLLL